MGSGSKIELQRQLYVPGRLGAGNLSHRRSQTHIRCIELDMVESIDEVGSELQPESLAHREVLMQTQVDVAVMRRTQISELRRAIAERSNSWLRDLSAIGEPLPTNS